MESESSIISGIMKSLKEMEGSIIKAILPGLDKTKLQLVRLHRVEDGGIWIESEEMTSLMFQAVNLSASSQTPIFFVPWHGVTLILSETEGVSLSASSFGV